MDLTLLGSTPLHSCIVLSDRTNARAGGACYEFRLKVTGGLDHHCSVSIQLRTR